MSWDCTGIAANNSHARTEHAVFMQVITSILKVCQWDISCISPVEIWISHHEWLNWKIERHLLSSQKLYGFWEATFMKQVRTFDRKVDTQQGHPLSPGSNDFTPSILGDVAREKFFQIPICRSINIHTWCIYPHVSSLWCIITIITHIASWPILSILDLLCQPTRNKKHQKTTSISAQRYQGLLLPEYPLQNADHRLWGREICIGHPRFCQASQPPINGDIIIITCVKGTTPHDYSSWFRTFHTNHQVVTYNHHVITVSLEILQRKSIDLEDAEMTGITEIPSSCDSHVQPTFYQSVCRHSICSISLFTFHHKSTWNCNSSFDKSVGECKSLFKSAESDPSTCPKKREKHILQLIYQYCQNNAVLH